MLHLYTADRVEPLAGHLAEVLAEVPADPLTPEWVAVPSEGMRRWLALELARTLGASAPGAGDGVAANIHAPFPGALRAAVVRAGLGGGDDPWALGRVVWAVLAELEAGRGDPGLGPLAEGAPSGRHSRARRVADLFDRYAVHRPALVRAWAEGQDVGPSGAPLDERRRWQAVLWRRVRRRLEVPSPPERLPGLLDRLAAGELDLGLPERLALFGLSVLPGGAEFLPLVEAVSARHDVSLYLLEPSPGAARHATGSLPPPGGAHRLRTEVDLARVRHPLLRSWGRAHVETAVLLADAADLGRLPGPTRSVADDGGAAATLLGRLQADLSGDRVGAADLRPGPADRSVQFHACHGPARQVEVVRDVVCHLLADDPTLSEDDVVVVCPALDELAPVVAAVLGPPAGEGPAGGHARGGPPELRYRLADRSLRSHNSLLAALDAVLELAAGRFTLAEVLDVLAHAPVRLRLGLSDLDLDRIGEWARRANVRWGLDAAHRTRFGVPASIDANSWQDALDRLLVGVAVAPAASALAVGEVAVLDVDGDDAERAGRLAQAFDVLYRLADAAGSERPLAEWLDLVEEVAAALVAAPPEEPWQADALATLVAGLRADAAAAADDASVPLAYADLRRVLADRLAGEPGRPGFFRGGMVVTSLRPLRWVPHRVVCLLGADERALRGAPGDGDDLLVHQPVAGDPDGRAEVRQALLETVLAARDVLVVVRDGRDVRTGRPVPPATPVAELRDAVLAAVDPRDRPAVASRLEVEHPRHGTDPACYEVGALLPGRPFGFDPHGLAGARARRRTTAPEPFLAEPLPERDDRAERVVDLAALRRFLDDPVASFLRDRLRLHVARAPEPDEDVLPVEVGALARWQLGEQLMAGLLAGSSRAAWERAVRRTGALPPGELGRRVLDEVAELALAVVADATALGVRPGPPTLEPVDVVLEDGTRVVGTVEARLEGAATGPALVGWSRVSPRQRLRAWLDLVALVAADGLAGDGAASAAPRRAVVVGRSPSGSPASAGATAAVELRTTGDGEEARRAARAGLAVVVDCYRRGRAGPVPVFPTLSYHVHRGSASREQWRGGRFGSAGDGDGAARVVYGDLDLAGLLALPPWRGDPEGRGGRVERFAHYLWGAVEASVAVDEAPLAGPIAGPIAGSGGGGG